MLSDDTNLPIALRRTPRRQCRPSASAPEPQASPSAVQAQRQSQRQRRQARLSSKPQTQTRQTQAQAQAQPKKRKRHSEPIPIVIHQDEVEDGENDEPVALSQQNRQHGRSQKRTTTTTRAKQSAPSAPAAKRRRYSAIPRLEGGKQRKTGQFGSHLQPSGEQQHQQQQIIRILPLRAILDDRVKRRLRRNGLSEEMNNIYADKRQRRSKTVQEMQRLREELAARDEEMERLRQEERESLLLLEGEASRLVELEREVLELRQGRKQQGRQQQQQRKEFSNNDNNNNNDDSGIGNVSSNISTSLSQQAAVPHHHHHHQFDSWDMGAADAFSDDDDGSLLGDAEDAQMGGDHDDDYDSTTVQGTETPISNNSRNTSLLQQKAFLRAEAGDVVKATATVTATVRPRRSADAATLTPPLTSPIKPLSPEAEPESTLTYCDRGTLPMPMTATTCSAGIQASFEDEEKVALAAELAVLRTDLAQMSESLAAQQRLEAGLRSKLSMAADADADADTNVDADGETDPDLLLQMDIMLQNLVDKTAQMAELKTSLASLVLASPNDTNVGIDAREMVRKLVEAVHAARQDLAQLLSDNGNGNGNGEDGEKEQQQPAISMQQHDVNVQEVLDTLLHRLKSATAQLKQTETDLQTSRAVETTLGKQLDASSEALTSLAAQVSRYEQEIVPAKDSQISLLSADVDRLHASAETYAAQLANLESAIAHLHTESAGAHARYDFELAEVKAARAEKAKQLATCEEELVAARRNAEDLTRELADCREARNAEVAALRLAHDEEKALEKEKVAVLRGEKEELLVRLEGERSSARDAVQCLRVQLLGAIKMSEVYLGAGVSSPSSVTVQQQQQQQQQQQVVAGSGSGSGSVGVEKMEEEDGGLAQAKSLG